MVIADFAKFKYSIKYIGGDDANKKFKVMINTPPNCFLRNENNKIKNISLSIGETETIDVYAGYNKTGLAYSPPTISIDGLNRAFVFPEDIQVLTVRDKDAKMTYEAHSLDYLNCAIIFSTIMIIVAVIELLFVFRLELTRDETTNKFFRDHDDLIKAHNDMMNHFKNSKP